ncbi:MAG TPA: class I SAM-dependent methyltransferase [Candidatus Dormibacteraeota bacterium]
MAADSNAQIYADYRPRYPQTLIDDIRLRTIGDRAELFVDWGCGTGELTIPLSRYFDRVLAVDLGADRISIAKDTARREGIEHIEWLVGKAESIEIAPESCDLIASASAFHWMDRELLSMRAFQGLRGDGALAVAGGGGADIWQGAKDWHKVAIECLAKYLDDPILEEKRSGAAISTGNKPAKRWHADFLVDAGFEVEYLKHPTEFLWPAEDVAGYMYSVTGGLPWALGDRREAFERDFSDELARLNPDGLVRETIDFFLLIATKP